MLDPAVKTIFQIILDLRSQPNYKNLERFEENIRRYKTNFSKTSNIKKKKALKILIRIFSEPYKENIANRNRVLLAVAKLSVKMDYLPISICGRIYWEVFELFQEFLPGLEYRYLHHNKKENVPFSGEDMELRKNLSYQLRYLHPATDAIGLIVKTFPKARKYMQSQQDFIDLLEQYKILSGELKRLHRALTTKYPICKVCGTVIKNPASLSHKQSKIHLAKLNHTDKWVKKPTHTIESGKLTENVVHFYKLLYNFNPLVVVPSEEFYFFQNHFSQFTDGIEYKHIKKFQNSHSRKAITGRRYTREFLQWYFSKEFFRRKKMVKIGEKNYPKSSIEEFLTFVQNFFALFLPDFEYFIQEWNTFTNSITPKEMEECEDVSKIRGIWQFEFLMWLIRKKRNVLKNGMRYVELGSHKYLLYIVESYISCTKSVQLLFTPHFHDFYKSVKRSIDSIPQKVVSEVSTRLNGKLIKQNKFSIEFLNDYIHYQLENSQNNLVQIGDHTYLKVFVKSFFVERVGTLSGIPLEYKNIWRALSDGLSLSNSVKANHLQYLLFSDWYFIAYSEIKLFCEFIHEMDRKFTQIDYWAAYTFWKYIEDEEFRKKTQDFYSCLKKYDLSLRWGKGREFLKFFYPIFTGLPLWDVKLEKNTWFKDRWLLIGDENTFNQLLERMDQLIHITTFCVEYSDRMTISTIQEHKFDIFCQVPSLYTSIREKITLPKNLAPPKKIFSKDPHTSFAHTIIDTNFSDTPILKVIFELIKEDIGFFPSSEISSIIDIADSILNVPFIRKDWERFKKDTSGIFNNINHPGSS